MMKKLRKTLYELCGGRPVDKYGVNQSFHWSVWGTPRTPMYAGGITTSLTINYHNLAMPLCFLLPLHIDTAQWLADALILLFCGTRIPNHF